ncbi:energy transducer TonB [Vibrio algarum]|uniref:TonB C-terminal domain-containing protein n=1 Tax=Vibrio algarum TaxID=3020714 RepID=A0ABT4YX07_9VIBR|nr:hypothetical protein [Vibrio sp. KJ40-1]MDB1126109.1 hypothetical protein [Vibrio sp. KJ40-1]
MRVAILLLMSIAFHSFSTEVVPIPLSNQEKSELSLWSELARTSVKKRLYLCEECFGHLVTFNVSLSNNGEVLDIQLIESSGEPELEHYGRVAIEQAQPFRVDFLSERTRKKVQNVHMTIVPDD